MIRKRFEETQVLPDQKNAPSLWYMELYQREGVFCSLKTTCYARVPKLDFFDRLRTVSH